MRGWWSHNPGYAENHWIVQFARVNFVACELNLSKAVSRSTEVKGLGISLPVASLLSEITGQMGGI